MLAIPSTGLVDIRWAINFCQFFMNTPPPFTFSAEWRYGIANTREIMVENALRTEGVTHILFIDSDIIMPINAAAVLLADNKPVVSGLYFNSLHTGVAAWVGNRTISIQQPGDLVQVDKVGMGLCLINLDVFRDMKDERPWFYYQSHDGKIISEDFFLFERLEKHGIKPWVDMRVKCNHLKPFLMTAEGAIIT